MTLYQSSVLQPKKMLTNLSGWLDAAKDYAAQREFDPDVLLSYRLAPDQYALARQVQIACDTAKLTAARLSDKTAPSHEDTEKTVDELKARIQSTVDFLDTLAADDFQGAEQRMIALPFAPGRGARGHEYFVGFAQPNFYFHVSTSYALLRHAGVPVGKRAYIGSFETEALPE